MTLPDNRGIVAALCVIRMTHRAMATHARDSGGMTPDRMPRERQQLMARWIREALETAKLTLRQT